MFFPGRYMLRIYLLYRKNGGWWKIPSRVWLIKASPNSHLRQSRIHLQQTTHKVVVIQQTLHGWRLAKHGKFSTKIASKKVDHEGPTTTKKVWKIWILPFQGRYQSFFFELWPAKSLANHALSSSICWRISGFCKTCLLSELISPVEGWKHPMVDASPTIGVSYQKLLSRFRDSKKCSTTLDLISSDIPSQRKICDSSRPPQLKGCQLRWHLADVDTARTLGGQWSLGATQIVVESTTTTTRSHVFFGRLEEDCQIFPMNNFWKRVVFPTTIILPAISRFSSSGYYTSTAM